MSVDESIFLARLAEQAARVKKLLNFLNPVLDAKGGDVLSGERNLLSTSFKNLIISKRTTIMEKCFNGVTDLPKANPQVENLCYPKCFHSLEKLRWKNGSELKMH